MSKYLVVIGNFNAVCNKVREFEGELPSELELANMRSEIEEESGLDFAILGMYKLSNN